MFQLPEDFLHFVWRSLYFDTQNLQTTDGQSIQIISVGQWNHDQGPDFLDATILINGIGWHGHVEMHMESKDWYRHRHHLDTNYDSVVLHVVWEKGNRAIKRTDGTIVPELVLGDRINPNALSRYHHLSLTTDDIPCASMLPTVDKRIKMMTIQQMAVERVMQKADFFKHRLKACSYNWDQLIWEEIAAMMGGPVNKEAFRELASRIPHNLLLKYREKALSLEALLMGTAGLLVTAQPQGDTYYQHVRQEWKFLQAKYKLQSEGLPIIRFSRMRPASFPTLRLAQLVALLIQWPQLTRIVQPDYFDHFVELQLLPSPYWETHYRFGESKSVKRKPLGRSQKEILLLNCLIPIGYLYGQAHGQSDHNWIESSLEMLSPENNRITRQFAPLGIKAQSAADSQGMIQLKKNYCSKKACLTCQIGFYILKN